MKNGQEKILERLVERSCFFSSAAKILVSDNQPTPFRR